MSPMRIALLGRSRSAASDESDRELVPKTPQNRAG